MNREATVVSNAKISETVQGIEEASLLQAVINAVPTPIFYKDDNGCYLGCNQAFEEFIGLTKHQLVGKNVFELFDCELAEIYQKADLALIEAGGKQIYEAQVKYADGSLHDVMFHKACFHAINEEITGVVGAILDITDRKKMERELQRRAMTDSLTGLNNRAALMHELDQAIRVSKRHKKRVVFLMLDLDDFKQVNDTYGHQAGDALLIEACQRLKCCVRESDILARFGGDEFGIVLERTQGKEGAIVVAEKIIAALTKPFIVEGQEARVGVSIGIARSPADGITSQDLMKMADIAMYAAKAKGKGQYIFYSDE